MSAIERLLEVPEIVFGNPSNSTLSIISTTRVSCYLSFLFTDGKTEGI